MRNGRSEGKDSGAGHNFGVSEGGLALGSNNLAILINDELLSVFKMRNASIRGAVKASGDGDDPRQAQTYDLGAAFYSKGFR